MKKSQIVGIAVILVLGAILAVFIWQSEGAKPVDAHGEHGHDEPAGEHADEGHEHAEEGRDHAEAGAEPEHDAHEGHEAGDEHSDEDHAREQEEGHAEGVVELSDEKISIAGIEVKTAAPAQIGQRLQLPGEITLNQDRTSHIVPRVRGVVESVSVELGQEVKEGQVLAVIASSDLSDLRSELLAAEKRLALAKNLFAREKQLWEEKISAERDYLQARQDLREAEVAYENARQKLQALGAVATNKDGLNLYEVRAPFDGTIVEKHIVRGEAIEEGANIFSLADLSSVWAVTAVPAQALGTVKVGTPALVESVAFDAQVQGQVAYVGNVLGAQTRTAPARVVVPNPEGVWRPGLFVRVILQTDTQPAAVTVDQEAIQMLDDEPVVFVRVPGGFRPQPVTLGRSDDQVTEVLQGLDVGTQYAAQGSFVIKSELGKASVEHSH